MKLRCILFLLVVVFPSTVFADNSCAKASDKLACVFAHHEEFSQKDEKYFWKILRKARDDALQCKSAAVIGVLRLASVPGVDGALAEWVNETIEKVCITQSKCVIRATTFLGESEKKAVKNIFANPLYHDPQELTICQRLSK